eukprot:COSAG04_NODE_12111_length_669_cov_1.919298_1_plen_196_part_01
MEMHLWQFEGGREEQKLSAPRTVYAFLLRGSASTAELRWYTRIDDDALYADGSIAAESIQLDGLTIAFHADEKDMILTARVGHGAAGPRSLSVQAKWVAMIREMQTSSDEQQGNVRLPALLCYETVFQQALIDTIFGPCHDSEERLPPPEDSGRFKELWFSILADGDASSLVGHLHSRFVLLAGDTPRDESSTSDH